jgi:hypothetical protein
MKLRIKASLRRKATYIPESVKQAIQAVQAAMTKYREFGAEDTEPRYVLGTIIYAAQNGKPFPDLKGGWQLYSGMTGVDEASKELTALGHKVYEAVRFAITNDDGAEEFSYMDPGDVMWECYSD